jgi:hypothetical protein
MYSRGKKKNNGPFGMDENIWGGWLVLLSVLMVSSLAVNVAQMRVINTHSESFDALDRASSLIRDTRFLRTLGIAMVSPSDPIARQGVRDALAHMHTKDCLDAVQEVGFTDVLEFVDTERTIDDVDSFFAANNQPTKTMFTKCGWVDAAHLLFEGESTQNFDDIVNAADEVLGINIANEFD